MAEKLKDKLFLPADVHRFADGIAAAWDGFDREAFVAAVLDGKWEERELKQRMRHLALCMGPALPEYPQALEILRDVADQTEGFFGIVLSEFVECFGVDDPDHSLPALQYFTRFGSGEFAIRPFLERDPDGTLAVMLQWTEDENEHVRRLASEGCRPRLPWAPALPQFKADPEPILPILEALKDDPSDYVRRSVANNLNDLSKDHPERVLEIGERWMGRSPRTDGIVKHACRTLLKQGHPRAMRLFGFGDPAALHVEGLTLSAEAVPIGGELRFSFEVHNDSDTEQKVRLEYRVDYVKARGTRSPKVFHITESDLAPGAHAISRRLSLQERSTRKHYPGEHGLAIVVNGVMKVSTAFDVTAP